jgi:hypothetical protein
MGLHLDELPLRGDRRGEYSTAEENLATVPDVTSVHPNRGGSWYAQAKSRCCWAYSARTRIPESKRAIPGGAKDISEPAVVVRRGEAHGECSVGALLENFDCAAIERLSVLVRKASNEPKQMAEAGHHVVVQPSCATST